MAEAEAGVRKRVAMRIKEGGTHIVEPQKGGSAERDRKDKADAAGVVESKEGAK